ncbi:uncharacterized protein K452DRAFT_322298 [Aplosporella prunicola CBS 121167]|uniref:Rab proteins geranylgeranyltransferase n=1 Tax=Aplosporella prunicola CBS 121167 TaxID=1176127 RepID=A0A6A6B0U4_9PEZI|nr:uncharacterized protein K452DRAFT_322298 [Aplosporella prunicola CBS 121167]KAF2136647.1 hypothetical protein K452DRAFT_322298 [Aplosporella prunicola CBS 121167]
MESLSETEWDVLIAGTGLEQSLLALALSRSGKKVLHVDKNDFYGGSTAAFSLQEAEEWAQRVNQDEAKSPFKQVAVTKPDAVDGPKLSASRTYSLSLSPNLVYTRSAILPTLVSSKVYRQLEFLAVGSWWVYSPNDSSPETGTGGGGHLNKVPSGREDIFGDDSIDFKAKRLLMKFLRFVADYENQEEVWQEYRSRSFSDFLEEVFKVPRTLHAPLLALTLSLDTPQNTTTEFALPRVANHLRSIGVFGPGFACVIPKWGGLAEISQVACRAQAVGGGIYVLGQGITTIDKPEDETPEITAHLKEGDTIKTKWVVGTDEDLPSQVEATSDVASYSRSISIVASKLESLFSPLAEGAPAPAGAVVSFPTGSLTVEGSAEHPPVYVFVHTSDTGECPAGQCVLYSTTSVSGELGVALLSAAEHALLHSVNISGSSSAPHTLWRMHYEQHAAKTATPASLTTSNARILAFPPQHMDLKFDGAAALDLVKDIWQRMEPDAEKDGFMMFEDREAVSEEEYLDDEA